MVKKLRTTLVTFLLAVAVLVAWVTPAHATNYFNCTGGVACIWADVNGGGFKLTVSVGQHGYNTCWVLPASHPLYDKGSSASADFGGGWDLRVWSNASCRTDSVFSYQTVYTSHFENWGGGYFNDESRSFMIIQA